MEKRKEEALIERDDMPRENRPDWEALRPADLDRGAPAETEEDSPVNGGIEKSGEMQGEDDDNAFQESDEALPDDREERAIRRHPDREGSRFDEI